MFGPIVIFYALSVDLNRQMEGKSSLLTTPGKLVAGCLRNGIYKTQYDKRGQPHKVELLAAKKVSYISSFVIRFLIDLIFSIGIIIAFKHPFLSGNYILKTICVDIIAGVLYKISIVALLGLGVFSAAKYIYPEASDVVKDKAKALKANHGNL